MTVTRVRISLGPLKRFAAKAQANSNHPAVNAFFRQAAARYMGYARKRFVAYSQGGGNWPALSPKTIAARRFGKGKNKQTIGGARKKALLRARNAKSLGSATSAVRTLKRVAAAASKVAILRDNGVLYNAMFTGRPGNYIRRTRTGIEVGIGGGDAHGEAKMTIGRLAQIHNDGLGHNPKRVIIPREMDEATIAGIRKDVVRMVERLGRSV